MPEPITFFATVVEASEAGDFVQILFSASRDDDCEYLLFQTQFEFEQDYDFKIEAKDGNWHAELSESTAILGRKRLEIVGCDSGELIRLAIDFDTSDVNFKAMRKTLRSMVGKLEMRK